MQHAKLQVLVSALSGRLLTSVFLVSMAHALPACCCHASTHSCMRQALGVPFSLLADEAAPPRPGPDAATLKNLTLLNQMQGNPQVNLSACKAACQQHVCQVAWMTCGVSASVRIAGTNLSCMCNTP